MYPFDEAYCLEQFQALLAIDSTTGQFRQIQDYLIGELDRLGYDRHDDYLMRNEFMAYLMQQNVRSVQDYFLKKAEWQTLNSRRPDLTGYVRDTNARPFLQAAEALNEWAFTHYGFAAGRVSLISKQSQ